MRIIHLSDIHLKMKENKQGIDLDSKKVLNALIKSLKEVNSKKKIDLILFTGDLIDKGGKTFNSIEMAFEQFEGFVLDKIGKELEIDIYSW